MLVDVCPLSKTRRWVVTVSLDEAHDERLEHVA